MKTKNVFLIGLCLMLGHIASASAQRELNELEKQMIGKKGYFTVAQGWIGDKYINGPSLVIRDYNYWRINANNVDKRGEALFRIVEGLSGEGVSLEYCAYPGLYLTRTENSTVKIATFDDMDPALAYSGDWGGGWSEGGCYRNTLHWANNSEASVSFTFTGTQAKIYGKIASWHGTAAIKVDNEDKGSINFQGDSELQALVFDTGDLDNKEHTIFIEGNAVIDFIETFTKNEDEMILLLAEEIVNKQNASFNIVPGIVEGDKDDRNTAGQTTISLQSQRNSEHYIRHANSIIYCNWVDNADGAWYWDNSENLNLETFGDYIEGYQNGGLDDIASLKFLGWNGQWIANERWEQLKSALADNPNITSVDLIDLADFGDAAGLGMVPSVNAFEDINPNCLIYTKGRQTNTINYLKTAGLNIVETNDDGATYTADNIALEDGYAYKNIKSFAATSISYKRNFPASWTTVSLPFDAANQLKLKELTGILNNKLVFGTASSIVAHQPYIVQMSDVGEQTFSASNAVVPITEAANVTQNSYVFKSTFSPIPTEDADMLFVLESSGARFIANAESIPAFRAYLNSAVSIEKTMTDIRKQTIASDLTIYVTNNALNIIAPNTQNINIYTIDGRLVRFVQLNEGLNTIEDIAKGIYLINNQKIVL